MHFANETRDLRSRVDCRELFAKRLTQAGGFDDFLVGPWPTTGDAQGTPVYEMRGRFSELVSAEHVCTWRFTPDDKGEPAIVLPVHEDGAMVDIVAMYAEDLGVWGCVTGQGALVGNVAADPLRIYRSAFGYALWGDGILVLKRSAFPTLAAAKTILAEDCEHADFLSEAILDDAPEANDAIGVDSDRFDTDAMTTLRAANGAYEDLKRCQ